MSYILQALQRAQAERRPNEGPGPGPDLEPPHWMTGPAASPTATPTRRRLLQVAGGLLGLTVALAAGWWFGRQAAPIPSRDSAGALAAAAQNTSPPRQMADAPTPIAQADARDSVPDSSPVPPIGAAPTTVSPGAPTRTPPPALLPREPAAPQRQIVAPTVAPEPAPLAVPREALPTAAQARLPPLRIGGAIGAERAADRMLLVDGRVVREGEAISPGLVLKSIGSRQAIFAWEGQRFSVAY